jgi:hypothetical protein
MATKAYMITDKANSIQGIVSDLDENNIRINWEDERIDEMSNDELASLLDGDGYDVEEVELTEAAQPETPAQASIQAHTTTTAPGTQADGNPKTRIEWMKDVIGAMASASEESLEAMVFAAAQAQIGGAPEHPTDGSVDKNRATITAKPSAAEGHGFLKTETEAVFKEVGITEEALPKVTTLFETAVAAAIVEQEAMLQEKYDTAIDAGLKSLTESLETKMDEFLDAVVTEWMEENKVNIQSTLRTELTMEFLDNLKNLFAESYIDVPEDKVNVLEAVVVENEELQGKINKVVSEKLELSKKIIALEKTVEVAKLSEGLTLPKKAQLAKLLETVEFEGAEKFAAKVAVIKEGFLKDAGKPDSGILTEKAPVNEPVVEVSTRNPSIAAVANLI